MTIELAEMIVTRVIPEVLVVSIPVWLLLVWAVSFMRQE